MSYIVCEKCGGYYKLEEEDLPDEFMSCNCGGVLKHVQNLNHNEYTKSNPSDGVKICPSCNGKNSSTSQICTICGRRLDNSRKTASNPNAQNLKPFATRFMELLNRKAITAGVIVFAAVFVTQGILIGDTKTFYAPDNILFLEVLIGGFAAGYMAGPEYRTGIFNGVLYGFLAGILFLTFIIVVIGGFPFSPYFTVSMIISGSFGALIGTTFQKLVIAVKESPKTGFLVCEKCGGSYEIQPGEPTDVFADKCECGGALKHVPDLNNDDELAQINQIGSKFRFHPAISIILGIVTVYILFSSSQAVFKDTLASIITYYILLILGGFIATYFSKEKKMLYGIYTGAGLFAISASIVLVYYGSVDVDFIIAFFMIVLFTSAGGFFGRIAGMGLKQSYFE